MDTPPPLHPTETLQKMKLLSSAICIVMVKTLQVRNKQWMPGDLFQHRRQQMQLDAFVAIITIPEYAAR
jgi:hypothetical protein